MGTGRDLAGSALVALLLLGYFDFSSDDATNFPERINRSYSSFKLWCQAEAKSPALHRFSKEMLMFKNRRSFCWFNCKGSDCTLLVQWLHWYVSCYRITNGPLHPILEEPLLETLAAARDAFQLLHSHPLWMTRECGQLAQYYLTIMVKGYKVLARVSLEKLEIFGFGLKPKLHAMDHISRDLQKQIRTGAPRILNPLAWSCEANESYVGIISRLNRRVNTKTVGPTVIERVLLNVKTAIRKYKRRLKIRPGRRS